ncbi:MAG: hypothetical protein A3I86_01615 [Candidatus Zambryskibacteria bacterium RIFCSPLOWO2_02_FULL_39_14]|uniref:Uncharacterized protein n=1 Tax=Candidatus Zambryskibacteria bacterium RIFCSPLOWO2_02_FULL_39_14 TaxID=1802769 RepID=A0A1G2UJN0_9BACT|nr:MAG: hypothetical protein A3I86_01615 [Candidatus Zambryskibacteria bacterium RIFCSPLOWO2_02_FULL_39_14]
MTRERGQLLSDLKMTMKMKEKKTNKFDTPQNRRKAEQALKLLLVKPGFQNAVEELRVKWGINKDNPNREQNLKKLTTGEFVYKDTPGGRDRDPDWHIVSQPNSPLYQDMFKLLERFRIDRYLMPAVFKLAKHGDVGDVDWLYAETMPLVTFKKPEKDWDTQPRIVIELRTNSTFQDVKKIWRNVEQYRKMFKLKTPKFKLWKNFDRDSKIYLLHTQGKNIGEIYRTLLQEDKTDLDFGNIKKIVSTYRKKLGLPKGGKLITSPIERKRELR